MSNIEIVQRGQAAWVAADWDASAELLADDFQLIGAAPTPLNKEQFIQLGRACLAAIPDWQFNARDFRESDDRVFCTVALSGTHRGILAIIPAVPAVPPTGKFVQLPEEHHVFTVRDGKLTRLNTDGAHVGGGISGFYAAVGVTLPSM